MTTREKIARIIEEKHTEYHPSKADYLATADAILALSPPEPTEGRPVAWQVLVHGRWCNLSEDWTASDNQPSQTYRPLFVIPPEPTEGQVEALRKELQVSSDHDYRPWSQIKTALSAALRAMPLQDHAADLPPVPSSLHWLGDREESDNSRHAMDMRGCVFYFEQQSDCLQFMRWLEARAMLAEEGTTKDRPAD